MRQNKTKLVLALIGLVIFTSLVHADSWTADKPSHSTLYVDTITSKTDASSVNIADSQGLFVTGDITTLGRVGIGTTSPNAPLQIGTGFGQKIRFENNPYGLGYFDIGTGGSGPTVALFGNAGFGGAGTALGIFDGTIFTPQLYVNGNVGIGTTTPIGKLEVNGNVVAEGLQINDGGGALDVVVGRTTGDQVAYALNGLKIGSKNAPSVAFNIFGGGSQTADFMRIESTEGGTRLLTVNSAGNVGIGTTSPSSLLHVSGSSGSSVDMSVQNTAGGRGSVAFLDTDGTLRWRLSHRNTDEILFVSDGTNDVVGIEHTGAAANTLYLKTGNVGIGTIDTSRGKFTVKSAGSGWNDGIALMNSGDTLAFHIVNDGTFRIGYGGGNAGFNQKTDGTVYFSNNVGIGTTGPGSKLHVVGGDIVVDPTAGGAGRVRITGQNNRGKISLLDSAETQTVMEIYNQGDNYFQSHTDLVFRVGSDNRMSIESNGNVGIGTTSPTSKLHVSGSLKMGSGAAAANKALCWMADNAIGYCSTVVDAAGACTCNAIT